MQTTTERTTQIETIGALPAKLRKLVANLNAEQLTIHSLENEWSVAQNVHHLADAHMNSFTLFKRMLSGAQPALQPYDPDAWADMADANHAGIDLSLAILDNLHARWVQMLNSLDADQFANFGINSKGEERTVDDYLRIYAGHGEAHLDQITRTLAAQKR